MIHTLSVLIKVTESLPIGTNLALLHFLWMLVSGALLPTRGAIFPALKSIGLRDSATRRAWGAFGKGQWPIKELVRVWRGYVTGLEGWTAHRIEGYRPVTGELSAKQMLGDYRQFVHAPESVQRLPELALLAGSILGFLAATFPPLPSGFWDRHPKATPGRFRRMLIGKPFPKDAPLSGQLREKHSVTDHLPKGFLARCPSDRKMLLFQHHFSPDSHFSQFVFPF